MNAGENRPGSPWVALLGALAFGLALLMAMLLTIRGSVAAAAERLENAEVDKPAVAVADHAEAEYCTPRFKEVLERVLHSCGLMGGSARRGCKPTDVKTFASISDEDFNALFRPLRKRGGMVLFDTGKDELDGSAQTLLEDRWADRRGARYFLVVGRASTTGTAAGNRALSHRRANSVLFHLKELTADPELERKVGLLWLGSEFAQLEPKEFCEWTHSREGEKCNDDAINRSAFASWVDCRL
jgi:outer membrane protein OmpA-like peptidoglycan-associated protein